MISSSKMPQNNKLIKTIKLFQKKKKKRNEISKFPQKNLNFFQNHFTNYSFLKLKIMVPLN